MERQTQNKSRLVSVLHNHFESQETYSVGLLEFYAEIFSLFQFSLGLRVLYLQLKMNADFKYDEFLVYCRIDKINCFWPERTDAHCSITRHTPRVQITVSVVTKNRLARIHSISTFSLIYLLIYSAER